MTTRIDEMEVGQDVNAVLHGYWIEEEYESGVEFPSDNDYYWDESYRQWCVEEGQEK